MSDEHQVCPMCHDDMCDGDCENYMDAKDRRIATLTAERDCYKDKIERFGNTDDPTAFDFGVLHQIDELEATIATLTAERDARDKQVRKLVDCIQARATWMMENEVGPDSHETAIFALAAQLKEQDDE